MERRAAFGYVNQRAGLWGTEATGPAAPEGEALSAWLQLPEMEQNGPEMAKERTLNCGA